MKLYLILLLFLNSFLLFGQNDVFSKGNEAYFKKDYNSAIQEYQSLVDEGYQSLELFTNLGTSYFQINQIGKAILYLEKAKIIDSSNPTVVNNLSMANEKIVDEIESIAPFFLKQWWDNFYRFLGANIWSILAILFIWGAAYLFGKWILSRNRRLKSLMYVFPVLFIGLLSFFAARSASNFEMDSKMGIVLETETHLKSGADQSSNDIMTIHEGLKVDLLDEIGDWYKVRLANGEIGWLPKNSVGRI